MTDRQNRTMICSVLFLDIVEYSRKPVAEQIMLRDRFNAMLAEALGGVAADDRIILDTGDGAAVSFLGDPEDALFMALSLRDALSAESSSGETSPGMRFGINLGPVKLVKDLNGQPNIIGDGINVAQRIMSFAEPGQVLVSRSYYEVVSRLDDEYAQLFHYEGSRTDKHVREHEVYAVHADRSAPIRAAATDPGRRVARHALPVRRLVETTTTLGASLRRSPRAITIFTVAFILGSAVGVRAYRGAPPAGEPTLQAAVTPASSPPPAVQPPAPAAASPAVTDAAPASARETPPSTETVSPPASPPAPAVVTLAVLPWGEIYVDGRKHGVSPPLRTLQLAPGRYRIEIRNAGFPRYVKTVNAEAGGQIRIRHEFVEGK